MRPALSAIHQYLEDYREGWRDIAQYPDWPGLVLFGVTGYALLIGLVVEVNPQISLPPLEMALARVLEIVLWCVSKLILLALTCWAVVTRGRGRDTCYLLPVMTSQFWLFFDLVYTVVWL